MLAVQRIPLQNKVALAGQSGCCSLKEINAPRMGSKVFPGASSNVNAMYFLPLAIALFGISDTSQISLPCTVEAGGAVCLAGGSKTGGAGGAIVSIERFFCAVLGDIVWGFWHAVQQKMSTTHKLKK